MLAHPHAIWRKGFFFIFCLIVLRSHPFIFSSFILFFSEAVKLKNDENTFLNCMRVSVWEEEGYEKNKLAAGDGDVNGGIIIFKKVLLHHDLKSIFYSSFKSSFQGKFTQQL